MVRGQHFELWKPVTKFAGSTHLVSKLNLDEAIEGCSG